MKQVLVALVMCLTITAAYSQKITHNFNGVTMSKALETIGGLSRDYDITFIYNEMDDYVVTTHVTRKNIPDAISQLIGFYPIKMTIDDKNIYVECVHKGERNFKGRVVDTNGAAIPFATIALLAPGDSTYLTGGVCNEAGYFTIPCKRSRVVGRVSSIGYKTINRTFAKWDMGNLTMEIEYTQLQSVTVKGERTIVKAENGHLTYSMPALLDFLPADNAYEALTRIPGVMDMGEGLTFTGRPVTLIINGKPTTLSADEVRERLKQMPAAMLAKAEVLPSTPAKYHVRGIAINVVTKDFADQLTGQLQGAWKQSKYALGDAKANFIYQRGNLGIDASYDYTYGTNYGQVEHEARHPLGDKRVDYSDKTRNKSTGLVHNYRIGVDYAFADDNRLGVAYTGEWMSNRATNTSTGVENSVQHSHQHEYLHNVDANYEAPFGLRLSASYTNYQNPQSQHLAGKMYEETRDLSVESGQRIGKWLFTADQSHALSSGWELNYGAKAQFTGNRSFQTTLDPTGQIIADATSSVRYDERILDGYVGFSKQFSPALSMEGSLAAEQYHAPKWHDWRIYPSFSLLWNVNKNNMLNLSLASDAIYPSYWSTMSDIFYSSAYTEIWGNPELKPSSIYNLNLTWQLRQRYTFGAFTSFQPDYAVQMAYQPSDRMAVIMKETNFDYSNLAGLFASARFNAGWWLNGTVNATVLYRHDKSERFFDLPFNRRQVSAILSGTVSLKFSQQHNLMLIFTPFFQSRAIQGVYDIDPMFRLNAQLRWTSRNGKWSIIAAGSNLTNTAIKTHSCQGNQDFGMRVWMEYPNATLTLIYRIGSFKEKKHKAVDTSRMGH